MAAYNLFIWLFLRERAYVHYVLLMFTFLLYQVTFRGIGNQYLWPNHAWLIQYLLPISGLGIAFFSTRFAMTFLQTQVNAHFFHRVFQALSVFNVLIFVQLFLLPPPIVIRQISASIMLTFVSLSLVGIVAWRRGYQPARYYLLAWGIVVLSISLFTASLAGLLPVTFATYQLVRPASVALALLLPLAVADRINLIRTERATAKASALKKAQENERLVQQQNVLLERQVAERTADLARTNEKLLEAKEQADTANKAKSRFLANTSHELRTPLNSILGFAQLLQRDASIGEEQLNHIEIIERSGQHLLALIDDVLDITRIEAEKFKINSETFALFPFLESIAYTARISAERKNLKLVTEFADDLPSLIHADELRLRQILLNLLSNAVKYTNEGHITFGVFRSDSKQRSPNKRTASIFD